MELRAYLDDFSSAYRGPTTSVCLRRRVDSTNELARRFVHAFAAEEETAPRVLLLALEQTAGKGRLGRTWASASGQGVYASLLVPGVDREVLSHWPMRAAVGLAVTVEELCGRPCLVKWPNDLLVGGAKIGGILIESVTRGEEPAAVVVGFGVNFGDPPSAVADRAVTSLRRENPDVPSLGGAAGCLVGGLEAALDSEPATDEYARRSAHRRGDILVCRVGEKIVHGEFAGFDARGFLRLQTAGGELVLSSAEVIEG